MREFNNETMAGLLIIDQEGRVLVMNQTAEKIFGVSANKALGKLCHKAFQAWDRAGITFYSQNCAVRGFLKQKKKVPDFSLQVKTRKGRKAWFNVGTLIGKGPPGAKGPIAVHLLRPIPSPMGSAGVRKGPISPRMAALEKRRLTFELVLKGEGFNELIKRFSLTVREGEILSLIAQGFAAKEISEKAFISLSTVRTHIQRILKKLHVHSTVEAITLVIRHCLF